MSRRRRLSRTAAGIAIAIAIGGCAMGPDYVRPSAPATAAFKENGVFREADPSDDAERGPWWRLFDDPLLDALQAEVDVSNQTLAASEAAFRQARWLTEQTRAGLYPSITLNGSVRRAKSGGGGDFSSTSPSGDTIRVSSSDSAQTTYQPSLGATWDLDVWGRIRRTLESDVASAQASAGDLAAARLSAQADLAANYFSVRAADERKRLLDASVAAYERSLRITENQRRWGVATGGDVALALAQVETTRSQAIAVGVQRAQLEHAIAVLAGRPPADLSIPVDGLEAAPPPAPNAGVPSKLLERRPDIAAAERRVAAANALIGATEAAYFPDVTLSASFGYAATGLGALFESANQFWSLGVAAAQTLFDAGARTAAVQQARAAWERSVADYRQTTLTAFQDVEDQLAALRILERQAETQDRAVKASRDAERTELNQYKAGTVPYTSVVTAQQNALANEQTAIDIREARFLATVNLIRALGGGWSADALPARIGTDWPGL